MVREKKKQCTKQAAVLCVLLMICVLTSLMPAYVWGADQTEVTEAADKTGETVRVGYYPVANYQDSAEDGSYSGFGYDYYMQIQKYTHWNYEFIEASYADCLKMLLSGEIDMMGGIVKTEARSRQMLFSDSSVSNTQNKLYCREDAPLYYEDYEAFDGCKVALLKGSLHDELDEYCAAHNFKVDVVEYESMQESEEALLNKDVDMVFATSISDQGDTKIVARLKKIPLYHVVNKDKPQIMQELDNALQKIVDSNPNFYTQMSEKYMVRGANATATFTKEESEYINTQKKIYVIMNSSWAPISWYDTKTGEFKGIAKDVLDNVEIYSGIKFEYYTEDEFNKKAAENPDMINNVLAVLADDNTWAVNQNVMMSNHIVDASVVRVTKRSANQSEHNKDEMIALPKEFYISWCMRNDFSEDQVVYYDTVGACLDAINEGKADATYVNELVATYYLSMLEYSDLFATANSGYNEDVAFAVNKDADVPLLAVIDKALLCIDSDKLDQIIIQNSIADSKISIRGLYYSSPTLVLGAVVIAVILLAGIIFAVYITVTRRKRLNFELEKELETSNARTEFFMMISHEVRTPLNAIVGYLNLMEEECRKNGMGLEYLNRSMAAAKQLTAISEDMLDYTRISSNSTTLREELMDMKEVVRDVEQNISVGAAKKEINFEFSISDINHEFILGDKLRITQIMQNLLSNAVKFTDAGGTVQAKVSQRELDDDYLELEFMAKDTGKGMSKDFLEKVCTPFNQSDKAYSRTHGGLGLGLYLTKYYLEAMHGSMDVDSTLGSGSTFVIHIPLKKAHSEQILNENISFSHVRVLIGGENSEDNGQLKELLKRLKIKSDMVTSKEQFTKRIRSRLGGPYEYKLCILDESFLKEDLELLHTIENDFDNPPVIFVMTQNLDKMDIYEVDERIAQVLYKPIFQSVLFDAVLNTFGEYRVEKEEELQDFSGLHAMIAEDNSVNADILMRVLKHVNMDATIYENGKKAVDAFEQEPNKFDIIFMDIQMPVMNGYEATAQIRKSAHTYGEKIPIVAVSANAFPEDIEKSLSTGMNEHLSKPISGKVLYQVIQKYCVDKSFGDK